MVKEIKMIRQTLKRLRFSLFILVLLPLSYLVSLEIPLEFHGHGSLGKYLNSDTIRYNMDGVVGLYCTLLRHKDFSGFVYYRDDLDMAEQTGGVSIDPRYVHYYIVGGIDYFLKNLVLTAYLMHDCVHDIDYDVEGTPVFNRFRLVCSPSDFHYSRRLMSPKKFLWSIEVGFYPHWSYHGWDINAGADYNYDLSFKLKYNVLKSSYFGVDLKPNFTVLKGDTMFYHKHVLSLAGYYQRTANRLGISLDYYLYDNDPIKSPDGLWLLAIFLEF